VRELYGVMAADGAAGGFVVSSGRFTYEAGAFAEGRIVRLLDGNALFTLIRSARGVERCEPLGPAEPTSAPASNGASTPQAPAVRNAQAP
jgi:restriction system protein